MFANPLPELVLGDPFILRDRGRFYLYGTNDGLPLADGRAIPVYRSDDLLHWEPLGGALEPLEPGSDHWAPEVLAWNGRFYMVVSFGDVERRGHALWIAVADRPEGPFRLRQRVSDPSEVFAIDGSWLLDDDGRLYLFHCLDHVAEGDPPHGTGIVVRPMRDPLTPAGPPAPVLRAHSPWHLFQADRVMPLYGGRTFAQWTTIEGPAPVKRRGRYFCGYSGGNYAGAYGTGEAVADGPLGPYTDLRGREGPLFGTTPGLVEGPGHFSVVRPDLVHDWIVLHGRRPGLPGRRVWLCPASWDADGVRIGPLTDEPQPPPPLPMLVLRGAGFGAPRPPDWSIRGGLWREDADGLRQEDPSAREAVADRPGLTPTGDWVAEICIRFPGPQEATAGLDVVSGSVETRVLIDPGRGRVEAGRPGEPGASLPLPTLGSIPFDPRAFHAVQVRVRGGLAEVLLDGVRIREGLTIPAGPARIGLVASGPAVFDALTVTTGAAGA
jgi:arabinan endo-1,5-alpha-L-arabinosidase